MRDWAIVKHNGDIVKGYSKSNTISIHDIWLNQSGARILQVDSNKTVVGDETIDPGILLYTNWYHNKVIEHFGYLNKIVVANAKTSDLLSYRVPGNVVINTLIVDDKTEPIYYKFLDMEYFTYYDVSANLGKNLEAKLLRSQVTTFANVNGIIACFKKIESLTLDADDVDKLDPEEFAKVEIDNLYIKVHGANLILDPVLKNPYITTLTISGHRLSDCTANLDNIIAIRDLQLLNGAKLNGTQTIPGQIIQNQMKS